MGLSTSTVVNAVFGFLLSTEHPGSTFRYYICTTIGQAHDITNKTDCINAAKTYYDNNLISLADQIIYGTILGILSLVGGMGVVAWDWLPLDFRLLFIGKPEDYNWDLPYNF